MQAVCAWLAGWFLLTGFRFQDTAGKPFFHFTAAKQKFLLRLLRSMESRKRILSKLTIVPADPSEQPFAAAISIMPVYANRPEDSPDKAHTHFSVRLIKLIAVSKGSPVHLLSQLTGEQRQELCSLVAYHPLKGSSHDGRSQCTGDATRESDETDTSSDLTSDNTLEPLCRG